MSGITIPPMNTTLLRFNCNDKVRVRLTDVGREVHRLDHEVFCASVPPLARSEYRQPVVDADGFSEWQLWRLMQLFGPCIYLGCDVPFHTDIEMIVGQPTEGRR